MSNPFELLEKKLSNIESLLLDLKHPQSQNEIEAPVYIDGAEKVTGLKKPTIYLKVSNNEIPHHKKGNRLYFFKSELIDWIKTGKRKTVKEVEADTDQFLSNRRKK